MSHDEIVKIITRLGTREQAARQIGVSISTIYRWLAGKHTPSRMAQQIILMQAPK